MAMIRLQDLIRNCSDGLLDLSARLPVSAGNLKLRPQAAKRIKAWAKDTPTLAQIIETYFDFPEWVLHEDGTLLGGYGIYGVTDHRKSTGVRYEGKWAIELDARTVLAKKPIVDVFILARGWFMPHDSKMASDRKRVRTFMRAVFGRNYAAGR